MGFLQQLFSNSMVIVWLVAMVVFLIVEAAVPGLVSIWFAIGSLAALISASFGAKLWLQILWFLVISIAALIATRPLAKKYVNGKSQPTNADRIIGGVGVVQDTVNNIAATGAVAIDGKIWTARSQSGEVIEAGTRVVVDRIAGVKLFVTPEAGDESAQTSE